MPSLVSQSKKRKFPAFGLLPWHKEATKGSSRLHDMSIAELEWAQAAKRIRSPGKNDISNGSGDQNLSKIVGDLIARAKKLEDELLRYKHDKNYHQNPFLTRGLNVKN
nr:hypothetical protein [Tanacetum cinerariifolium]